MEHLLSAWPKVAAQLKEASRILLLSDYDGTLTRIVERPELADMPEHNRRLLQALARSRRFTVGIVSGRAMVDLKQRVGINGIVYAGNHGLEIEGPGLSFVNPVAEDLKPVLRVMNYVLGQALKTVKGAFVEDKGLSLTVHYRQAEQHRQQEVEGIVKQLVGPAEASGRARITMGKKVYEVRPAVPWDKGKAIKLIMKRYGKGGRLSGLLPMYLGDDMTDEDGFKVIDNYGEGISVLVGEPGVQASAARYFVQSPAEITTFLGMLLAQEQRGFR